MDDDGYKKTWRANKRQREKDERERIRKRGDMRPVQR
jgi:hypothetical protein